MLINLACCLTAALSVSIVVEAVRRREVRRRLSCRREVRRRLSWRELLGGDEQLKRDVRLSIAAGYIAAADIRELYAIATKTGCADGFAEILRGELAARIERDLKTAARPTYVRAIGLSQQFLAGLGPLSPWVSMPGPATLEIDLLRMACHTRAFLPIASAVRAVARQMAERYLPFAQRVLIIEHEAAIAQQEA